MDLVVVVVVIVFAGVGDDASSPAGAEPDEILGLFFGGRLRRETPSFTSVFIVPDEFTNGWRDWNILVF